MIPLAALVALIFFAWQHAGPAPLALLAAAFLITFVQSLRILKASVGGVGGHAEWVRDVSLRPRLGRSSAWAVGLAFLAAGIALGLWEIW
jgi:hypothetical protein